MSAKILSGAVCANEIYENIKEWVEDAGESPVLVIYSIGDDPASAVYVRNKVKAAEKCGITAIVRKYPADADYQQIKDYIALDATNPFIHGIMIQLPLPEFWEFEDLVKEIPAIKDVDGLTATNAGLAFTEGSDWAYHNPCTAAGIRSLLCYNSVDIAHKDVVVVGRSAIVGKPVAQMMLDWNATVTICHSCTVDLAEKTRQADILIVAAGRKGLITPDMVKPGAVVVDVGINRDENGKLCGDVASEVAEVAGAITPVPGGVGPMTVAMLMRNTWNAYCYCTGRE